MWYKGVSFSSDQCALVYLVDSAGTRTTTDVFTDLTGDITLDVFYKYGCFLQVLLIYLIVFCSRSNPNTLDLSCLAPGTHLINQAVQHLEQATHWTTEDRTDNWLLNGVRISQTVDGLVR